MITMHVGPRLLIISHTLSHRCTLHLNYEGEWFFLCFTARSLQYVKAFIARIIQYDNYEKKKMDTRGDVQETKIIHGLKLSSLSGALLVYRAVNELLDTFEDLCSKLNLKIARVEMITVNRQVMPRWGQRFQHLKLEN